MKNRSMRARILNIVVPLLLTIVGSFLVLELGLRYFYQLIPLEVCASDYILGNYYCQPYFVYDKPIEIGYRYDPGLKLEGMWDPADPFQGDAGHETRPSDRTEPFWFVFETDEMGFPNSQYEWQEAYDIIVTGDSFVERTAPRTWIEILGEQTGKDILTLGASSWTTLNEVEAVKKWGLDKNPDWVVLMYFEGNDLVNAQQYLQKKASGLSWREYDMQGIPFYRRWVMYYMLKHWLTADDASAESAEPANYRYPVTASTEVGEIETVLKDIHLLPMSADYETISRSDEFAAVKDAILELDRLTKAQDTKLLVVYIPAKAHVYWSRFWDPVDVNNILERTRTVTLTNDDSGTFQWGGPILSYDVFNANHSAQERVMSDFAAESGIEFLNLTPIFWEQSIKHGEFYHYGDTHWNQAGNQLVADEVQKYIEEHGD